MSLFPICIEDLLKRIVFAHSCTSCRRVFRKVIMLVGMFLFPYGFSALNDWYVVDGVM